MSHIYRFRKRIVFLRANYLPTKIFVFIKSKIKKTKLFLQDLTNIYLLVNIASNLTYHLLLLKRYIYIDITMFSPVANYYRIEINEFAHT